MSRSKKTYDFLIGFLAASMIGSGCGDPETDKSPKTQPPSISLPVAESSSEPKPIETENEGLRDGGIVQRKPMLLEFTQETCLPCKIMKPWISELKKTFSGKIDIIEIDLDVPGNQNIALYFGIHALPTQVYIDKDGRLVTTHSGLATYDDMKQLVIQKLGIEP